MNKVNVSILGAGGHTRSIINLINSDLYHILGIYDDNYNENSNENVLGIGFKGVISEITLKSKIILSIGDNHKRKLLFKRFDGGVLLDNLIHKTSLIEQHSNIGNSNQIFANSYINSLVSIGNNNIINTGCLIEHESHIGSHNHISIGSIICGRVYIGNECFLGAGSVIKDKIKICDNVVIGANSLVINDIINPGVYVGSPVIKIK